MLKIKIEFSEILEYFVNKKKSQKVKEKSSNFQVLMTLISASMNHNKD